MIGSTTCPACGCNEIGDLHVSGTNRLIADNMGAVGVGYCGKCGVIFVDQYDLNRIKRMKEELPEERKADVPVFKSRYTPGLKNGGRVHFDIGEKVRYRMRNGTEYTITIDSDLMSNDGYFGYEAIFPDGKYFAVADGIIDWEGKQE